MGKIHILDKAVYELIAAGEVIDRPSSVVKEMVENAIDAGANKVVVEIKNGGRVYMRITDNGCGMSKEDVPLAFVRHATSKISSKDDLESIMTLGFRGEALASICAVSKVEVMTKPKGENLGYLYIIEGGEEKRSEPIGCPDGTTFIIRDLFFNVPARQKYMKKDVTEGNAIASTLQKLALSHPEVSIKFIRDNKVEFVTSGDGKLLSCIYTILGRDFYESCIPVDYDYNGIGVHGYVTKPLSSKANRTYQNFFVNSRYIKSSTCLFALEEAYKGRLMVGKFPGCVLNLNLGTDLVDINSHPSKLEIRFQDERAVYSAVYFAVKNSLMLSDEPAEIKLKPEKGMSNLESSTDSLGKYQVYKEFKSTFDAEQLTLNSPSAKEDDKREPLSKKDNVKTENGGRSYFFVPTDEVIKSVISNITSSNGSTENPDKKDTAETHQSDKISISDMPAAAAMSDSSKDNPNEFSGFRFINSRSIQKQEKIAESEKESEDIPPIQVIGEAFKTYIIAQCGNDVLLIDKHAAHERYLYEKIKKNTDPLDMQLLINPFNTTVSYEIYDAISNNLDVCKRLGIGIKILDAPYISVYGIPSIADNMDPLDIVTKLADSLLSGSQSNGEDIFDDLYHSIACKAAIKANSDIQKLEMDTLLKIITQEDLRYCPHGRPILVKLTKREIEKMFRRIQ